MLGLTKSIIYTLPLHHGGSVVTVKHTIIIACCFVYKKRNQVHSVTFRFHYSTFSTVDQVLEAARHMVAMQIARDPLVRQCVRQTFYERAKLKIKPTKRGKKVILPFKATVFCRSIVAEILRSEGAQAEPHTLEHTSLRQSQYF